VSAALAHQNASYQLSRVGRAARDADLALCRSQMETFIGAGKLREDLTLFLRTAAEANFDAIATKNTASNAKEDTQARLLMRNYADTTNILCPSEGTAFDDLTMEAFFRHQQELLTAMAATPPTQTGLMPFSACPPTGAAFVSTLSLMAAIDDPAARIEAARVAVVVATAEATRATESVAALQVVFEAECQAQAGSTVRAARAAVVKAEADVLSDVSYASAKAMRAAVFATAEAEADATAASAAETLRLTIQFAEAAEKKFLTTRNPVDASAATAPRLSPSGTVPAATDVEHIQVHTAATIAAISNMPSKPIRCADTIKMPILNVDFASASTKCGSAVLSAADGATIKTAPFEIDTNSGTSVGQTAPTATALATAQTSATLAPANFAAVAPSLNLGPAAVTESRPAPLQAPVVADAKASSDAMESVLTANSAASASASALPSIAEACTIDKAGPPDTANSTPADVKDAMKNEEEHDEKVEHCINGKETYASSAAPTKAIPVAAASVPPLPTALPARETLPTRTVVTRSNSLPTPAPAARASAPPAPRLSHAVKTTDVAAPRG
jgi:hypothetical protein